MAEIDGGVLIESVVDGVALLTLNRPDRLNALDTELMRTLREAVERIATDNAVGCVVLTGSGRAFCAGGDMNASRAANEARAAGAGEGRRTPSSFEKRLAWLKRSADTARLLYQMRKPTIAMVNGSCAGAGLSLAGACDLRIAGESAVFTSAFVNAGISGDYGGSWFWTRILGTGRARELFLLGEKIDARRAYEVGMVTRLVPDAELHEQTMELAKQIAARPRSTNGYLKDNLAAAELLPLEAAMEGEATRMLLSRMALMEAAAAKRAEEAVATTEA